MSKGVYRTLAVVCGLLLALPPGWCYLLSRGQCCVPTPVAKKATPQNCPKCSGTSPDPEEGTHCPPGPSPPREPGEPCQSGCCLYQPTAVPKTELPGVAFGPADGELVHFLTCPARSVGHRPNIPAHPTTPPLYVLHCIWLC
jgi:hypothetical protein